MDAGLARKLIAEGRKKNGQRRDACCAGQERPRNRTVVGTRSGPLGYEASATAYAATVRQSVGERICDADPGSNGRSRGRVRPRTHGGLSILARRTNEMASGDDETRGRRHLAHPRARGQRDRAQGGQQTHCTRLKLRAMCIQVAIAVVKVVTSALIVRGPPENSAWATRERAV